MPFGSARFNEYDVQWIPEEIFATDQRIADFEIGLGDELYIVGLFTRFFGQTILTPIVRTGRLDRRYVTRSPFGNPEHSALLIA